MFKIIIFVVIATLIGIVAFSVVEGDINADAYNTSNSISADKDDSLTVTLSGEVTRPGTYYLVKGATLGQAIEKASGVTSNADPLCYETDYIVESGMSFYIAPIYDNSNTCSITPLEKVNIKNILLILAGFAISFMLSIKSNPYSNDNFLYLFLCGIVGATGMVVPGISGSHLMLLMGNYELLVTEAIPALTKASTFMHGARILFPFALGSVVSIVSFSYLLSWLMRDFRNETLSALAGFMLGSLPVVYPWKEPTADMMDFAFHLPQWNSELLMAVVMMVLGAATVYLLELMARHTARKQAERLLNPKPKRHGKKTQ